MTQNVLLAQPTDIDHIGRRFGRSGPARNWPSDRRGQTGRVTITASGEWLTDGVRSSPLQRVADNAQSRVRGENMTPDHCGWP